MPLKLCQLIYLINLIWGEPSELSIAKLKTFANVKSNVGFTQTMLNWPTFYILVNTLDLAFLSTQLHLLVSKLGTLCVLQKTLKEYTKTIQRCSIICSVTRLFLMSSNNVTFWEKLLCYVLLGNFFKKLS